MRVFVYRNLLNKCWSVRALEGDRKGLVIAHAHEVHLSSVIPKVSEAGRQRVIRHKAKNVHAGLVGDLVSLSFNGFPVDGYPFLKGDPTGEVGQKITYNPYRMTGFSQKDPKGHLLLCAESAYLSTEHGVTVIGAQYTPKLVESVYTADLKSAAFGIRVQVPGFGPYQKYPTNFLTPRSSTGRARAF